MPLKKTLICIVGPTAVGKTHLAITVAKHYQAEIISADSRQMFKQISIGTAKPTKDELSEVKHHFVDFLGLEEDYSAGKFEKEGLAFLDSYFLEHDVCVCAGGSGLYVNALLFGLDDLPSNDIIRQEVISLYEKEGISALQNELEKLDPESFQSIDRDNTQRLMRAIEVCKASGKKYSELKTGNKKTRSFEIVLVGLERDREELYDRINSRVDLMMNEGLLAEVDMVYPKKHLNSLNTVGYKEFFGVKAGDYSLEEAVRLVKRNSRRFAKRQLTWFKRLPKVLWFHPDDKANIIKYLDQEILK